MQTLPNGVKKFEASDNVTIESFNVNAELMDSKIGVIDAATPSTTANTLVKRDSGGRYKAANPVAADDVARKDTVDNHAASTSHVPYAAATGSANTYAVTISPAPPAYVDGLALAVRINVNNTGASTVNVNGLGAVPVKKSNGNAVSVGNLRAGSIYTLRYSAGNFILQGEGGEYGTATAVDVLSGKTIGTESGLVTGTMPNQSAPVQATGTAQWPDGQLAVYFPAGYYNGAQGGGSEVRVSQAQLRAAEPEFIATNILAGVNLFGILGTAPKVRIARGSFSANAISDTPVNGLGFQPELIIFSFQSWTGAWAAKELFQNSAVTQDVNAWKQGTQAFSAVASVNSDGFVWLDTNGKNEANVVFVAFRFS